MDHKAGKMNCKRRRLILSTVAVGGLGGLAAIVPFVSSMLPSERAKAAGAPVEVDISKIAPGQKITVEWQGKPVWVFNRTKDMLDSLAKVTGLLVDPESKAAQDGFAPPKDMKAATRSIKDDLLVVVGVCTHLGCSPSDKFKSGSEEGMPADWAGGFLCPCHGSTFDLAGRVYKNKPAPTNLPVPPYTYLSDTRILIGVDKVS